jgi:NAD(P)-dependent dehydrogenase (short-subunit alcohol dehydrogenase family)
MQQQPAMPAAPGPDFSLTGRRVLVTGATGGIGTAICEGLAHLGASVVASSRDPRTAAELAERYGTAPCVLDLRDVPGLDAVLGDVWDEAPIDVLVNNAGVNHPASVLEVTESDWDEIIDTNLKGVFFLTQAFARRAVTRDEHAAGGSAVVNIGSQAGSVGLEERAAYCASKGGLEQLTKVLAIELATSHVRVNCVAPTFVHTEMTRTTFASGGLIDRFLERVPLGRFAAAEEVVGAVAFLAGAGASMVTGTTLAVDGGWTAW